jgi:hypothetical protein
LSTECHFKYENARKTDTKTKYIKGFEECVRRRATMSLAMHPACAARAQQTIADVFAPCMADNAPFGYKP